MLKATDKAPDFTLETDDGQKVTLSQVAADGKPVVLFFYPKDDTPGCTIECKEFRDARPEFLAKAHVYGISPDDVASHVAFREKYGLNFPLLADPGHKVADQFGVWGETQWGTGILRTTFIVRNGVVERVFEGVKPTGHAAQVLAAL